MNDQEIVLFVKNHSDEILLSLEEYGHLDLMGELIALLNKTSETEQTFF
jgi:Mn-containing catalase